MFHFRHAYKADDMFDVSVNIDRKAEVMGLLALRLFKCTLTDSRPRPKAAILS